MKDITLNAQALEDLNFWSKNDHKLFKKIFELFTSITRTPTEGIGKPEALKGDLKGYWSRINEDHRIVYSITSESIIVISCRSHYKF